MLSFVKHGQKMSGTVVGTAGLGVLVDCGAAGRVLVFSDEADDPEQHRAEWHARSPIADVQWQTEDGPVDLV